MNLDDAVRAAMQEHSDRPVVGWVLVAATMSEEDSGEHELTVIPADGQLAFATAGLLTLGMTNLGARP